jgi:hypothetical protein
MVGEMDLDTFVISEVMIHDVPRGGHDATEMTLTDAPITLDTQLRRYFFEKITGSLRARGVEVVMDQSQDATVRDAIARVLRSSTALAQQSRLMAERLHQVQTGVNPPGLLTVISGTVDRQPAVTVLKLEREQGIRFRVRRVRGQSTVDLQFLRDLTLTNKTKVFKTSLFTAAERTGTISGRVSDDQRGLEQGRGVADFFLNTYLGCQLRVNPARTTFEFVQTSERFFNEHVQNPETRGRYQVALLSTMQDQRLDISPRSFASTHLATADRSAYNQALRDAGLDPGAAFEKDLSLVKVTGFRMTFESGMVLVGGRDDLRERVHIRGEDDSPGVDIMDAIKQLRGR